MSCIVPILKTEANWKEFAALLGTIFYSLFDTLYYFVSNIFTHIQRETKQKKTMVSNNELLPPPGRSGGTWGTTTFVGSLTWAAAIAALPTIIGSIIILLFLPLDKMDVYRSDGKLYSVTGEYYKAYTSRNFTIEKVEHTTNDLPEGKTTANGDWGTTQYIGNLTWSLAIASIPTLIGPFIILLFLPIDQMDGEYIYTNIS